MSKQIGKKIKLGRKIGFGSMGEVFLGTFVTDQRTGKHISAAIKRVPASKMDLKEVTLQSELSHLPQCNLYVACLYEMKKIGDNYYIVMEYIKGKELFDVLANLDHELGLMRLKRLFKQALEGLAFIHSKGIAHGDIKMENFMLDEGSHRLKYIDFGYGCNEKTCKSSPVLHGTGYLDPPEAFKHETVWSKDLSVPKWLSRYVPPPDSAHTLRSLQRADIWALGSMFVEMLLANENRLDRTVDIGMSGEQLKDEDSRTWLASDFLKKKGKLRGRYYDRLYAVIDGMMKLDPDDRITAKQALKVLTAKK
jgi:serine/threonine protein kinase